MYQFTPPYLLHPWTVRKVETDTNINCTGFLFKNIKKHKYICEHIFISLEFYVVFVFIFVVISIQIHFSVYLYSNTFIKKAKYSYLNTFQKYSYS